MDFLSRFFLGSSSSPTSCLRNSIIDDAQRNITKRYSMGQVIGQGSFGVVRKCQHRRTKEWLACKSICKRPSGMSSETDIDELRSSIQREVSNLRTIQRRPTSTSSISSSTTATIATGGERDGGSSICRHLEPRRHEPHPNLLELVEVFEDESYVHLITELCTGGELYDKVLEWRNEAGRGGGGGGGVRKDEVTIAVILYGILDALQYLHDDHSMAHRDLKASNFLFYKRNTLHIKIIDFGLSKQVPPRSKVERHQDTTSGQPGDVEVGASPSSSSLIAASYDNDDSSNNNNLEGFLSTFSTPFPSTRNTRADLEDDVDVKRTMAELASAFACNEASHDDDDDEKNNDDPMDEAKPRDGGFVSARSTPISSTRNSTADVLPDDSMANSARSKLFMDSLVQAFTCNGAIPDDGKGREEDSNLDEATNRHIDRITSQSSSSSSSSSSSHHDSTRRSRIAQQQHARMTPCDEATATADAIDVGRCMGPIDDDAPKRATLHDIPRIPKATPRSESTQPSACSWPPPIEASSPTPESRQGGESRPDPRSFYGTMTSEVGTPYYVAPEVLLDEEYTCLCDIWSIGVIAYLLLSGGHLPLQGATERDTIQLLMRHTSIEFPSERWQHISPDGVDFVRSLLQKDPRQRPTAQQALSHPWMVRYCGTRRRPFSKNQKC